MSLKRVNFSPLHTFARATVKNVFQPEPDGFGGTDYILKEVASGAPAFAWNPETGESKGLTIHEARTNYLWSSSNFDGAGWTKTASLGLADVPSVIAGQTASRATGGGADQENLRQTRAITGTSGTGYCIIEKGSADTVTASRIRMQDSGADRANADFNWSTEVLSVSVGTGKATKLTDVGPNGGKVFLLEINSTAITSGAGVSLTVFPIGSAGSTATAVVHHVQLENGAFATPPIITGATSATRAADVCTIDDLSGWYNSSEWTIVIDHALDARKDFQGLAWFSDAVNTNNRGIGVSVFSQGATPTTPTFAVYVRGSDGVLGSVIQIATGKVYGDRIIAVITRSGNVFKLSVNGQAPVSFTHTGADPLVEKFNLGIQNAAGTSGEGGRMNGSIANIQYYPQAVSDTQLRELSAL